MVTTTNDRPTKQNKPVNTAANFEYKDPNILDNSISNSSAIFRQDKGYPMDNLD